MDCYSVESEFIESLDFLSPPVKRIHTSREALKSIYQHEPNNVHLLRGLRNKFVRRAPSTATKHTRTVKTNAESSTSLILKKTSERQILEHYSILSYTSLQHQEVETASQRKINKNQDLEKPIIQVTVIPKGDQAQTAKILRKRRFIPKRIQNTTSNHENSVQTKNVYLIVAGRRREKIYEIKTTGSAQFSTDHESYSKDDELPIKEISHFKHLMNSLSMDKKRKKSQATPSESGRIPTSMEWKGGYPKCNDCMDRKEEPTQVPMRSRVKIFGQFGISEDDKYILRYGATVNDKEVLSDVAQLTRDFSPVINTGPHYDISCDEDPDIEKDVVTELREDINKFDIRAVTEDIPSKESQGTQVNFNIQVSSTDFTKNVNTKVDKKTQCSCATETRSTHKILKECQSPLVIISVYPKQSPEDLTNIDLDHFQAPALVNAYTSNQIMKADRGTKRSEIETRNNFKRRTRSPSPSPIKKASKTKTQVDNAVNTRLKKTQSDDRGSPDRQMALRAIKDKIKEKDKLKQVNKGYRGKQPSKFASNGTQASTNAQNLTLSNATQVSNKNRQNFSSSNGTQLTTRDRMNYNVSNATQQYGKAPQKHIISNAIASINSPQHILSQIKHQKSEVAPVKHSQASYATNATQIPRQYNMNSGTQASYVTASNGTQISSKQQNFIPSRLSKNQETYTVPITTKGLKSDKSTRKSIKVREKGVVTEHAQAKKALVDSYTKKLTEKMNQKDIIPARYDSSKVTINIEGDKEYYDVLFNQDKLSTDIKVRKTLKDMGSQICYENERSISLENSMFTRAIVEARGGVWCENKASPTKSMSIGVDNNPSDDESSPLTKNASRLTIRDSLEISHRREDKGTNNMKNTQTCFTAQFAEDIPDETEFLAPIKHFTGDDCSICDPIERDKQIRELLGVDKTKLTQSKTQQAHIPGSSEQFPYHYIYRQQCEKSRVAEINFQFQKLCPCLKHKSTLNVHNEGKSVSVQCQHTSLRTRYNTKNYVYGEDGADFNNYNDQSPLQYVNEQMSFESTKYNSLPYATNFDTYPNKPNQTQLTEGMEEDEQYFESKEKSAIYQQLILNRNIQVFLQVDQFSKQKPIILSRKQYNKVKKTIQKTICKKKSSHDKRKRALGTNVTNKYDDKNELSIGEVKKHRYNKTDISDEEEIKRSKYDKTDYLVEDDAQKNKYNRNELSYGELRTSKFDKNEFIPKGKIKRSQLDKNNSSIGEVRRNKYDRSEVSVGEIRKKKGNDTNRCLEKEAQTDFVTCTTTHCKKDIFSDAELLNRKRRGIVNNERDDAEKKQSLDKKQGKNVKGRRKKTKSKQTVVNLSDEEDIPRKGRRSGRFDPNLVTLPYRGEASWHNEQHEEETDRESRNEHRNSHIMKDQKEKIGDRSVDRQKQQNAECSVDLYRETVVEGGIKNFGEVNTDCSPKQYGEQVRDNFPENIFEARGQKSPERYSERKSFETHGERRKEQSFETHVECRKEQTSDHRGGRSPEYRRDMSPEYRRERTPERKREVSPERRSERRRERSSDQHREQSPERHRERSPERYRERSPERCRERSPERYSERSAERYGEQSPERYKEQSPERYKERSGPERYKGRSSPDGRREKSPEQDREPSPEHHRELSPMRNRARSPEQRIQERHSERTREPSTEQYKTQKRNQISNRYIEEKQEITPSLRSEENKSNSLDSLPNKGHVGNEEILDNNVVEVTNTGEAEVKTLVLFNAEDTKGDSKKEETTKDSPTRKTMSSVEIRYASIAYMKQLAYSSTDVGAVSDSSLGHVNSFHTIFRGHRKSPTPNLGTSVYSLYSEDGFNSDKSAKYVAEPRESKPKKPFLRRLMSCLVMRSRESEQKLPVGPIPEPPSVNSSIDSYHISTSLCAVEVSSSIYDTSASFYSNHTILPVNSKIKRGFFSSVRGFLTNRKS